MTMSLTAVPAWEHRPDRMTMEGMIYNANEVLWEALQPGVFESIPKDWTQNAKAVALLSVAQVGLIVAGSIGTGILLRKKEDGLTWSHPSACGIVGLDYGFLAGISLKHMIVFIAGEEGMNSVTAEYGLTLGGQAEATLGFHGRTVRLDWNFSNRGHGISHTVAFSKGAFLGVSAQGAVVGTRVGANHKFYGVDVSPRQILMDDNAVQFPPEWMLLMDEVHAKLVALTMSDVCDDLAAPSPNVEQEQQEGAEKKEEEEEKMEKKDFATPVKVETNGDEQFSIPAQVATIGGQGLVIPANVAS